MPHIDLLELPYFDGLSIDDLVPLVDLMEPRRFEPGEVIVVEGSPPPQPLFIATTGKVVISKLSNTGEPRDLAELVAPTLFGEIELFCQIPTVCTATATSPVDTFALSRDTFDRLFAQANGALMRFNFNVARVACHRLAIADELLAQVLTDKDLCEMRRSVFSRMSDSQRWSKTTGVFKRPG